MSPLIMAIRNSFEKKIFELNSIDMIPNFLILGLCALIPFLIGFIWFHPKAFGGRVWQQVANLTDVQMNKPIKPIQLLASLLLNFLLAFGVFIITVHGTHVLALTGPDIEAFKSGPAQVFMQEYGANFQNMSHGIGHGLIMALFFFVIPILGYAVIFERKKFKYLLVNAGFWAISLTLMACIITRWGGIPVY